MREILFRGKTKENGEWVQGYFVYSKSDFDSEELREADIIPHNTDRVYKGEYNVVYPCIPETVGQYTGLTDKNGKKIFENGYIIIDNKTYKVTFNNAEYILTNIFNCDTITLKNNSIRGVFVDEI